MSYTIEFFSSPSCDPSNHGEGEAYLGSDVTGTDVTGQGIFRETFSGFVPAGAAVTATATFANDTSEFSECLDAVGVPPVEVPGMEPVSGTDLVWEAVPGATMYHLYQGFDFDLPKLLTSEIDSCLRWSTPNTSAPNILVDVPQPGSMHWYLVLAEGIYGVGTAGDATDGPRLLNSAGSCGGCTHDKCVIAGPLSAGCDACIDEICLQDPFCCDTAWDDLCVQEVRTICGSLTCQESAGQCAHPLCEEGDLLTPKCDDPPITPSCVDQICAIDPFCCQQAWDSVCVSEVSGICGYNCN